MKGLDNSLKPEIKESSERDGKAPRQTTKIAVIVSRPGRTDAKLKRILAEESDLDLIVYYLNDVGTGKSYYDPEFNREINFGVSMLEGYRYKFLKNIVPFNFFKSRDILINPGIVLELVHGHYDCIIVYGWNILTHWLAFITAFLIKLPVLLRGESPLNQDFLKPRWKVKIKKMILPRLFNKIAGFLYIGEENRKFYKHYGVPDEKLFFSPNPVDNDKLIGMAEELRPKRDLVREELGIKKDEKIILFVGKLSWKKRPLDLIKAFEMLEELSVSSHLLIVGDGVLRGNLEDYVRERAIKKVHFVGFKSLGEVPAYYAISDVFVLPSGVGETWGFVVNEAMCFSLPIIVSNVVGCGSDLVRHGENGFVFPVGDDKALANCLKLLITDSRRISDFGKKSLEIIGGFNYDKNIQAIREALRTR